MKHIIDLAIKKAKQSDCRYKVSAIGFNKNGDIIGSSSNKHLINRKGCSLHAEVNLIKKHARSLRTIIICRTNNRGDILPIQPCRTCSNLANKYGIIIKTIKTINSIG